MLLTKPSRRHLMDAARAAAEARRRKREMAVARGTPDVFVVRLPGATLQFGREIGRFGATVLDQSRSEYPTTRDAYAAGREALAAQGAEA